MTPEQHKQVIDFYNQSTNEQHAFFLQLIDDKISLWKKQKTFIKSYKIEHINLNGIYIDVHIKKD